MGTNGWRGFVSLSLLISGAGIFLTSKAVAILHWEIIPNGWLSFMGKEPKGVIASGIVAFVLLQPILLGIHQVTKRFFAEQRSLNRLRADLGRNLFPAMYSWWALVVFPAFAVTNFFFYFLGIEGPDHPLATAAPIIFAAAYCPLGLSQLIRKYVSRLAAHVWPQQHEEF